MNSAFFEIFDSSEFIITFLKKKRTVRIKKIEQNFDDGSDVLSFEMLH